MLLLRLSALAVGAHAQLPHPLLHPSARLPPALPPPELLWLLSRPLPLRDVRRLGAGSTGSCAACALQQSSVGSVLGSAGFHSDVNK